MSITSILDNCVYCYNMATYGLHFLRNQILIYVIIAILFGVYVNKKLVFTDVIIGILSPNMYIIKYALHRKTLNKDVTML